LSDAWIPSLAKVADLRTLSLTTEEAFVLSRVDGRAAVKEIADVSGLPRERVEELLASLVSKGALLAPPAPVSAPAPMPAPAEVEPSENENENEDEDEDENENEETPAADEGTARRMYAERFAALDTDARVRTAGSGDAQVLLALAFDPEAVVVRAVLTSDRAGTEHARAVALHHRNAMGLDAVATREAWLRDRQVQRCLLRNPVVSESLLKRIFASRRLADVYKAAIDTDSAERARLFARTTLRARFNTTSSEEKAALVFSTEGRVLALVMGLAFDARTVALLCSKTYTSILMVQNLARFPATPAPVLAHLLRQAIVKRQPHLKATVLQHPNTPSEAKRQA
jgi:hypothetical protein